MPNSMRCWDILSVFCEHANVAQHASLQIPEKSDMLSAEHVVAFSDSLPESLGTKKNHRIFRHGFNTHELLKLFSERRVE